MDQDHNDFNEESFFNLPAELLIFIISFLSSVNDLVSLTYVSRWLKCVIEGTPSLWRECVLSYYDSCEECRMKEVLKVCGQQIKVLFFPFSRVPPTLVEMLQYYSNVQHLSLPSTKLRSRQLRRITKAMQHLETLEFKIRYDWDEERWYSDGRQGKALEKNDKKAEKVLSYTGHLKEIRIISELKIEKLFTYWRNNQFRPPNCSIISNRSFEHLLKYAAQQYHNPTGTTASFRVFKLHSKAFTPPVLELQIEVSGQITTPCVKLNDFGILGLENDLAVMTDYQYNGQKPPGDSYGLRLYSFSKLRFAPNVKQSNLQYATNFELYQCSFVNSGHLEQLAVACPNLQRLNLEDSFYCLESLQGLRAIASHCHNLQGLNLLGICTRKVEDHFQLWEVLRDMNLTKLGVEYCMFRSKAAMRDKLTCLLKSCLSIKAIECKYNKECYYFYMGGSAISVLPCFTSLHYCFLNDLPTASMDVINDCKKLRHVRIFVWELSLSLAHIHNLQQLCIQTTRNDLPDDFVTSVSAHGGLVHVVIDVPSLTTEGIISLVENSPKLITLFLTTSQIIFEKCFISTLQKMFYKRKLFTAGYCHINDSDDSSLKDVLYEQGTDLQPLWN